MLQYKPKLSSNLFLKYAIHLSQMNYWTPPRTL